MGMTNLHFCKKYKPTVQESDALLKHDSSHFSIICYCSKNKTPDASHC